MYLEAFATNFQMFLNKVYILTSTNFLLRFYNSSTKFLPKKHLPILLRHKYYSMMYASSDHNLDVSGEQSYTQAVFVHIFQSFPCAFSRAVAWKRRVWQGIFRAAFTRAVALQPRTLPLWKFISGRPALRENPQGSSTRPHAAISNPTWRMCLSSGSKKLSGSKIPLKLTN